MKNKGVYLFPRLLAIGLLLLASAVFAIDSDGDGVDNSIDAFPGDGCATVDTDSDGMPDTLSCINEGFESGSFSPIWISFGGVHIGNPGAPYSGTKFAVVYSGSLQTTLTIYAPQTLSFFYVRSKSSTFTSFSIDGVNQSLGVSSGWLSFSKLLQPGEHTLRWANNCYSSLTCAGVAGNYGVDDVAIGTTTSLVLDLDDDNDGVADTTDKFPLDPTETLDNDNDGIGNNADTDDDNDTVLDVSDNCPTTANATQANFDGDAQGDTCDNDDDNDGVADSSDAFDFDPTESVDTDHDGIGNNADTDDDNDTVLDSGDNCPLNANTDQVNTDGDAQGNVCDTDDDNDGTSDGSDKFPLSAAASSDSDNDGFPGSWNAACDVTCQATSGLTLDNCPSNTNVDQLNTDGDAQGNVCDTDDDGDSISDIDDSFPLDITRSEGNSNILFSISGSVRVVSGAGDVNNDSYDDVIVGNLGEARVFNGKNGSIIYTFNGPANSVSGAGDMDNDGYDDVLVGDSENVSLPGSVRTYSGRNGNLLYTFNGTSAYDGFGASVSSAGDVNNDGYADVIVGIPRKGAGAARIFSGLNGNVLYTFNGYSSGSYFGTSVSGAGDVNNDGYADVIVGADSESPGGTARIFSGANGGILYNLARDNAANYFGRNVSGAGDINNDGYADVIVGVGGSGGARTFSGVNGVMLNIYIADDSADYFGWSVSGAGDVNNDGYADVIVGAINDDNNGTDSGSARVYSGQDQSIIYTFDGDSANAQFGWSVSDAGDVNNDGYADVIVRGSGVARVFSGKGLWTDTDGDSQNDATDPDDDNDGALDVSDAFPLDPSESVDTDGDGIGNNADWDDDNDGVPDTVDAAPLNTNDASEIILPLDNTYKGLQLQNSESQ